MSIDDNKALARRYVDEVLNKQNLDLVDQIYAPNCVVRDPSTPDATEGTSGVKQFISSYLSAFPDNQYAIDEIIGEGDLIAARWSVRGTHKGQLGNIAATGKQMGVTGMSFWRIENGKIAEEWLNWDALGLMQQLGVVPSDS